MPLYKNYPKAASEAAQRALDYQAENQTDCGTAVGWTRARQLANRETISIDTVKRTFSFLSRAKTYDSGSFEEDGRAVCGSIMYAAWGGDTMRNWCERTIEEYEKESGRDAGIATHEVRYFNLEKIEMRTSNDNKTRGIAGYGVVFDDEYRMSDEVYERIAPDALEMAEDVLVAYNHDFNLLLGRTSTGTATITVDERGAKYEVKELPTTSYARDLKALMERGDVAGSSFTFSIVDDEWTKREGGGVLRTIKKALVYEMGPVALPAYETTTAMLRAAKRARPHIADNVSEQDVDALLVSVAPTPTTKKRTVIDDMIDFMRVEMEMVK